MKKYCVNCKKYTSNTIYKYKKTEEKKVYLVLHWLICGHRKSTFVQSIYTITCDFEICGNKMHVSYNLLF